MLVSKCSNLEAKNVLHFKLVIKKTKGQTMISKKQSFKNKAFKMKIKMIENFTMKIKTH